jgi:hypothetical protein
VGRWDFRLGLLSPLPTLVVSLQTVPAAPATAIKCFNSMEPAALLTEAGRANMKLHCLSF